MKHGPVEDPTGTVGGPTGTGPVLDYAGPVRDSTEPVLGLYLASWMPVMFGSSSPGAGGFSSRPD